jgi:hypothetical protein
MIRSFVSYNPFNLGLLESDAGPPSLANWEYYLGEGTINNRPVYGQVTKMVWDQHVQYPYELPKNWFLS